MGGGLARKVGTRGGRFESNLDRDQRQLPPHLKNAVIDHWVYPLACPAATNNRIEVLFPDRPNGQLELKQETPSPATQL